MKVFLAIQQRDHAGIEPDGIDVFSSYDKAKAYIESEVERWIGNDDRYELETIWKKEESWGYPAGQYWHITNSSVSFYIKEMRIDQQEL